MVEYFVPVKYLISMDTRPTEDPEWVDVSDYVLQVPASVRRGRDRITSRFDAGEARFTLDNFDRRFEPGYSGSPYYPNLKTTRRVRICGEYLPNLTDSFDRANTPDHAGNQLGSTDTGQAWTASTGNSPTLAPQWHISSNKARLGGYTGVYNEDSYAVLDAGTSDAQVRVTFVTLAKRQAVVWRWVSLNSFYFLCTDSSYATYSVYYYPGSHSPTLLYTLEGVVPTAGDVMEVRADGSSHFVYVNGTLRLSFTNTQNLTATRFGMGAHNNFTHRDVPEFDDLRIVPYTRKNYFDGYIESIECLYHLEAEATIVAVDGFKALNLLTPSNNSGIFDTFNRQEGEVIQTADSGQKWTATSGDWEAHSGLATIPRSSSARDDFTDVSGRPNLTDNPEFADDYTNHLGTAPSGQEWIAPLGGLGGWIVDGPASPFVRVQDWLSNRADYEAGIGVDSTGLFRVGLTNEKSVNTVTIRLDVGDNVPRGTGSAAGYYLFGSGDSYWAILLHDKEVMTGWGGTPGLGVTVYRVVDGVRTVYSLNGEVRPGIGSPTMEAGIDYGALGFSSSTWELSAYIEDGKLMAFAVPVVEATGTPQPQHSTQIVALPMGSYVPGSEVGLLHNGVSRVDGSAVAVDTYRWGGIIAGGPSLLVMETGLANGDIEAIVKIEDSRLAMTRSEHSGKGIVFRYTDDRNYLYANVTLDGTGSPAYIRLWKVVDNDSVLLDTHHFGTSVDFWNAAYSFVDRRLNRMRVSLDGESITVSWFDTVRLIATDSHNVTATKHGLYHGNSIFSSTLMDDVDWDEDLNARGVDEFRMGRSMGRQLTGERIDVLLDLLGWPYGDRLIDDGTVYVAPLGSTLDLDPNTALDHIYRAVDAEYGSFYFDSRGRAVFEDRNSRLSKLTVATIFDDQAVLGPSYAPGLRLRLDDASIYNEVKVTAELSEHEFFSGVLDADSQGPFDTGETGSEDTFTIRYITREITLGGGAVNPFVRVSDGPGPYGPWTLRPDLYSAYLVENDEQTVSIVGATQRYKQVQLFWSTGTAEADIDIWMNNVPVEQVATDPSSIADHYKRTWGPTTVPLTSDADALELANIILDAVKESVPRIEQVRVEPFTQAEADEIADLDISSRVQIIMHPKDGSAYLSQIGFVEGVALTFGVEPFTVEYSLSQQNAGLYVWILDDPSLSVLGETTRLA